MARLINGVNDLATTHPELVTEWHPTKNDDLTPQEITAGSNKKVRWIGRCGHEWEATVKNRAMLGSGCPFCIGKKIVTGYNDLATKNPALAEEWHPRKNKDLTPSTVTAGSDKKVWWLGKCGHEWEAKIYHRNNGRGCPFCANMKVIPGCNDLATANPKMAAQWHPRKNGELLPSDVTPFSNKKVWWLGPCGHEWQTKICNRSTGSGCPMCRNTKRSRALPRNTVPISVQI